MVIPEEILVRVKKVFVAIIKDYYGWYGQEYTAQALADKHCMTVE